VPDLKRVIGVDVGGTKILAGIVDAKGNVARRREWETSLDSQETLLAQLDAVVDEFLDDSVAAVGFGLPSRIDPRSGHVDASVNIPLADVPLRDRMADRFQRPIAVENDGNAAALAEFLVGAGRDAETIVMLTLGTGVGGGVVIDRKLLRDGGELGHTVIEFDGLPCHGACTGRGHLEAYVSGTAATNLARAAFGPAADAHRLVRLAAEGDRTAVEILDGIGRRLGAGIGSFINIFRPDVVVVGGGFAAAGSFLLRPAEATMRREALPPARERVRLVRAELRTAAGVIGAGLGALGAIGVLEGIQALD
jgi:glucokinase